MTIVLHHYAMSPFSEVLRLALGQKGADWWSVTVPNVAPKPLLTPLTGGYRKTPVLQIDADVYCDTAIAIEAIEMLPGPSLFPPPLGRGHAFVAGAAHALFLPAVFAAIGPIAGVVPAEFWTDREALFGFDRAGVEARTPHYRSMFVAGLAQLEATLADGRAFVGGDAAGWGDLALYMLVWFQRQIDPAAPILDPFAHIAAWAARVHAIGLGNPHTVDAQEALAVAHGAMPDLGEAVAFPSGFHAGQSVTVATEDPGADRVAGSLLRLSDREIVIRRDDPDVGTVAVHFPRLGQILRPA